MAGQEQDGAGRLNVMIVGQSGRLQYEAILFAVSLALTTPRARLFVAEPQPGPLWPRDPRITDSEVRALLEAHGATFVPFESRHFGAEYPYGNKIEALFALPEGEPFVFFDTDTLVLDDLDRIPFDFARPTASLRREDTWPKIELYGPGYTETWRALYDRFGLDFESSLDLAWPEEHWRRHLYFNAGVFFYECPHRFGRRFLDYALSIRDDAPPELVCQSLDPWLDQVALPLVIHSLGGGRDTLPPGLIDGTVTCHYRSLPLLYAREEDAVITFLEEIAAPNRIKRVLKEYEPIRRMLYQGRGHKARALFDRENLPRLEQGFRNRLKREGFWMR
ncbi:MAG: hypothetical protein CML50_23290 [Rhodobacteraceae bacterium]|jgi:hypothetical protein|uniref:Uncharacterized protein n=1 Tax=Salipiger profundus TaxID=1229727 RepID=A0A1U7D0A5_9RHOB|nr:MULTISPECIES: hypothetical protein [Salipiger]APX21515.1 hypothetical protein Ga0080559_TMP719 [Salipiger profundus]MAB08917.1 hypothetical protein [Paracoccaceae bacterium]GGA01828.1 hypothetical protein GCM10011326_11400 [Salipiger profundus]SFC17697.1 hypothetical protein SAMN05444415_102296 [Salipiger profundus]